MTRCIRPAALAAALLAAACATSAPPPTPQSDADAWSEAGLPVEPAATRISLFCTPGATTVAFSQLQLPVSERPVDVALTADHVWVLFQPARLLRFDRAGGKELRVKPHLGRPGEIWTGLAADPVDGAVWVATRDFGFLHVTPDLEVRRVQLQRDVIGRSGLKNLLAAPDALYLEPFCGEYGVWRVDREGKVLGKEFRADQGGVEEVDPATMNCAAVRLVRAPDGGLLAWEGKVKKHFRVDHEGVWSEAADEPLGPFPGCSSEQLHAQDPAGEFWYAAGFADCAFSWKGRPVFLVNSFDLLLRQPQTLFVVPGGETRYTESCSGSQLLDVTTDGAGYAGLLKHGVVFGSFATAPDLPAAATP